MDNTTFSNSIYASYGREQLDTACKKILAEKQILAWIMKSCLEEYKDIDVNEIAGKYIEGTPEIDSAGVHPDSTNTSKIQGINSEDSYISEGTVNFDIRFLACAPKSDGFIRLIINLEAQKKYHPGYPLIKRGIYYCSRLISSQYGTEFANSEYGNIKKVYSIWICMNPPKHRENTITRYEIAEQTVIGDSREKKENFDLLSVIMVNLGKPDDAAKGGILRLLDELFHSERGLRHKMNILKSEYNIPMTQEMETEVSQMCNFSDGFYERGLEHGMKQGMKQGVLAGKEEQSLLTIRELMKRAGWTAEQTMEMMNVPEQDRKRYLDKLGQ